MTTMRTAIVFVILCTLGGVAGADDKAAAEAAFVKARRLMKEGKTAEACDAFATSQRLDPQFGTQYNLALCYEQLGRLASAFVELRELAQRDTNAARKKDSAKRADAIEPRLTKILINAPSIAGLKVMRDGRDVTNLVGIEDPVDPGAYTIVATAGGKRFEKKVEAKGEGAVITVEVTFQETDPDPVPDPVPDPDPAPDPDPDPAPDPEPDPDPAPGGGGGGRTILGLSGAAVGGIAIGVGLYFGSQASATLGDAKDVCGGDLVCPDEASRARSQELVDDARAKGNLSTIFVAGGAVIAAAGVILWLTAPDGSASEETALRLAPQVGPDGVGLVAAGRF